MCLRAKQSCFGAASYLKLRFPLHTHHPTSLLILLKNNRKQYQGVRKWNRQITTEMVQHKQNGKKTQSISDERLHLYRPFDFSDETHTSYPLYSSFNTHEAKTSIRVLIWWTAASNAERHSEVVILKFITLTLVKIKTCSQIDDPALTTDSSTCKLSGARSEHGYGRAPRCMMHAPRRVYQLALGDLLTAKAV